MSSPASGPAVSVVIITRNRRDALGVVLDRLAELPVDEVLVVDNGSDDDTAGYVRARNGVVRLLEPGENIGIAGRNLAAREARGEFLLMLDDDSYPLPGAVEVLVDALRANPSLAAAGALVRDVDGDGRVVKLDELGTFDWWLRAGREGEPPPEGFPAFFFPEGAAMIRRSAYLDVGGFFEPYFVASTELDLAARLFQAGWDVRYFPTAVVDHMKAEAGRGHETGLYYRIRNHLWYIWLRYPTPVAMRRTLGYLTFDLIESTYRGVPKAWARAVRDAWRLRARVHGHRSPLARSVRRRAELNRGRMHVRLLAGQMRRRLPV
jgi:N-acetylglucosaminyl-diphospho-decaprenol L-rhamnosyltransferase